MSQLQQYLGRFSIGTDAIDFGINSQTASLDTGTYYICAHDSESSNQLCEHLQAEINTHFTGFSTTNVYLDSGFIKIDFTTDANMTFDDSGLATILGMNTSLTGTSSYTGDAHPRYCWFPSRTASDYPTDINKFWAEKSTTRVGTTEDGTSYTVPGNLLYDATVGYTLLNEAEVIIPGGGTNYAEFQQFWIDVAHAGQPIRVFPDRTQTGSTDYVTGILGQKGDDGIGSFLDYSRRHLANYNGFWDVTLPLLKDAS
jgi:hypothetical protein